MRLIANKISYINLITNLCIKVSYVQVIEDNINMYLPLIFTINTSEIIISLYVELSN